MASFYSAVLLASLATLATATPLLSSTTLGNDTDLAKRQYGACSQWTTAPKLVGDGDPHQVWYDKQISDTLWCDPNGNNDCQEEHEDGYTITIEADLGLTQPEGWFSGGFAVSYSWEATDGKVCGSHENGESNVCVWYSTAFTAYTVQNVEYNECTGDGEPTGEPAYIITSPNADNRGGRGFYCVVGTCRTKGQGYWHDSVPGTGP